MKILVRIFLAAALVAVGVWLWSVLFPSPERVILKRLSEIAKAASFGPNESALAKLANVQQLVSYFSSDVEVRIETLGRGQFALRGRDELSQAAMGARSQLNSLDLSFPDVNVTLGADRESATVDLTARAVVPSQKDFEVQEMNFTFRKINGQWLITRVETVKTLT